MGLFNRGKSERTHNAVATRGANLSSQDQNGHSVDEIANLISTAAAGNIDKDLFKRLVSVIRRSVKMSRKGVTISGQGIADVLAKIAPRIPVSDLETMRQRSGGMSGDSLAAYQIKKSSRQSAAVGALVGGVASAQWVAPPTWLMLPAEILVETLVISAIEMKMVAELHVIYGHPITGTMDERGRAILAAWADQRGISVDQLDQGLKDAAHRGARGQLVNLVRRKLIARAARNVSSVAPFLVGAGAAGAINRGATRTLGNKVVQDLGHRTIDA